MDRERSGSPLLGKDVVDCRGTVVSDKAVPPYGSPHVNSYEGRRLWVSATYAF